MWNPPDPYDHVTEPTLEEMYPCDKCKGTGISLGFGNVIIGCNDCDGTGYDLPDEVVDPDAPEIPF